MIINGDVTQTACALHVGVINKTKTLQPVVFLSKSACGCLSRNSPPRLIGLNAWPQGVAWLEGWLTVGDGH